MSLFDNGFYYVIDNNKYKAIQTENLNKCILCDFNINGKCSASKQLIIVCNALNNYYWTINNININNTGEYIYSYQYINNLNKGT